ncbi:MAG: hypothetical protein AABZ23_06450 [Deltaproteobacteria bacterium]
MLIDKTNPEFNDVPSHLDGQILLERTVSPDGQATGWLTISSALANELKAKTDAELEATGYLKYKSEM